MEERRHHLHLRSQRQPHREGYPEGRWNYQYDYANRLVAVYKDGLLIKRYLYDHTGLRIGAVDAEGRTTVYLYDLAGNLIQEREGGEIRNYIWALGKHLARVDGTIGDPAARVYWYHTDHLGTVQVISDAQGQVVWRNEYRAFGEQLGPEVEEIENAQAFTGKDWDEEVGLYYFNARWYDPELGRFISEDPVGDPNNPNLYVYCANNPLTRTDPTGYRFDQGAGGGWYPEAIEDESEEGTEEEVPPSPGEAQENSKPKVSQDISPVPSIINDPDDLFNLNRITEELKQKYPGMDISLENDILIIKTNGRNKETINIPQLGLSINGEIIVIEAHGNSKNGYINKRFYINVTDYLSTNYTSASNEKAGEKNVGAVESEFSNPRVTLSMELSLSSNGSIGCLYTNLEFITQKDAGLSVTSHIRIAGLIQMDIGPFHRVSNTSPAIMNIGSTEVFTCSWSKEQLTLKEKTTLYFCTAVGPPSSGGWPGLIDQAWIEVMIYDKT